MNKIIGALALVLVVLSAALVVTVVPSVEASAVRGCVTKYEYRQVRKGMRMVRVHRIFDTSGRRVAYYRQGSSTAEVRSYRTCRRGSAVSVSYARNRVAAKSAVWRKR